ncbi:hypothetical protein MKS83_11410 [Chryseobacterium sp. Y16C]|uniref:hypothetical protein n=1 Tax=Chryseobacterium sp. Y16C TaxID=2920939 RepID=UPI001F0A44D2|nr:hypothetical protein [Chryseobacterium sp. Y16C]UMQ40021.1 hypothetical protein MKS83_11410 [Chryseobacterium sp. Y16C]
MKRLNLPGLALSLAFAAISANMKAQDAISDNHDITITIPSVAILDIEPSASKNISMGFTAPTEAGLPIAVAATNNTLWLNYSSIKTATVTTRHISAKLDALIPGVDIKVTAAAAVGGAGALGTPSTLTLTATDQSLISLIGSAYTEDGSGKGHNLTYTITPGTTTAYGNITATANVTAKVTYTFVDN